MRIKKYAAAFLAATTVLGSLAACGNGETDVVADPTQAPVTQEQGKETEKETEPDATPTPAATPIPARDLGGAEYFIGDWWSPETPDAPKNAAEEATLKYREEIFAKYNFTMQAKKVADWGTMQETVVTSISEADPVADVIQLDYRFVAMPLKNGMFYDLATLSEFDFTEDKWNQAVKGLMTKGSSIYGMLAGKSEPRGGVVFNKRVFEEAGYDPDYLYDLQASGDWTWSKFEEICAAITKDKDGDGNTDVYGHVSQNSVTVQALAMSAGCDFVGKDENGKLFNNTGSQEALDAMNFAKKIYDAGYEMPQPEGSNWDYFKPAFQEGKAAMQFCEEYMCQPAQSYGDAMEDPVGFVMPPKPDGQEGYMSYVCDNIAVMAATLSAEEASNIAFAYNVYTMATPGYDDPNAWKETYYTHFEDERAVDETIAMFNDGVSTKFLNQTLVGGLDANTMGQLLWAHPFKDTTPADKVAEIKDGWDAIIAEAN